MSPEILPAPIPHLLRILRLSDVPTLSGCARIPVCGSIPSHCPPQFTVVHLATSVNMPAPPRIRIQGLLPPSHPSSGLVDACALPLRSVPLFSLLMALLALPYPQLPSAAFPGIPRTGACSLWYLVACRVARHHAASHKPGRGQGAVKPKIADVMPNWSPPPPGGWGVTVNGGDCTSTLRP